MATSLAWFPWGCVKVSDAFLDLLLKISLKITASAFTRKNEPKKMLETNPILLEIKRFAIVMLELQKMTYKHVSY